MKLIIGLGNPSKEYNNTRHNIGFMIIDNYANKSKLEFHEKFNGLYAKTIINSEQVIFLKPLSFMNLSGTVVKKYVDYYKINEDDILVVQDDLDLPIGRIKLKPFGSSGGHNGIKNIIDELRTSKFKRFKIGISNNKKIDTKDYVLGNFNSNEKEIIHKIEEFSNNIIDDFVTFPFEKVMSKYNGVDYEINERII